MLQRLLVCFLGAVTTMSVWAGETEEAGRAVLEANADAVVTVEMVVRQKISMGAMGTQQDESVSETTGTVIGADGLTVLSLSATDPSAILESMMGGMMGDVQIDTEITDVKIILTDGAEIESQIVLRDKDLDLAFARPTKKPAEPMAFVDMASTGTAEVLDEVVSLERLGKVANRASAASFERIHAVVDRPRLFYVPAGSPDSIGGQGAPVFALDGNVLGLLVMRTIKSTGGGGQGLFSAMNAAQNLLPIILPASDVMESAEQAPMPTTEDAEDGDAASEEAAG